MSGHDAVIAHVLREAGSVEMRPCNLCDGSIYFKDRVAYNRDDSEHRCISNNLTVDCRHCKKVIRFLNRKPFNVDGTPHRCLGRNAPLSVAEQNHRDLLFGLDDEGGAA